MSFSARGSSFVIIQALVLETIFVAIPCRNNNDLFQSPIVGVGVLHSVLCILLLLPTKHIYDDKANKSNELVKLVDIIFRGEWISCTFKQTNKHVNKLVCSIS
jgi:hypothetical protein